MQYCRYFHCQKCVWLLKCYLNVDFSVLFFFLAEYSFAMQPPSMIAASSVGAVAHGSSHIPIPKLIDQLQRITKIESVSPLFKNPFIWLVQQWSCSTLLGCKFLQNSTWLDQSLGH